MSYSRQGQMANVTNSPQPAASPAQEDGRVLFHNFLILALAFSVASSSGLPRVQAPGRGHRATHSGL